MPYSSLLLELAEYVKLHPEGIRKTAKKLEQMMFKKEKSKKLEDVSTKQFLRAINTSKQGIVR